MNPSPGHTSAGFPALVNRSQLRARRANRRQRRDPLVVSRAVAVDASRSRRYRCVRRIKHRVVAISAIELELARVQRMAKRHRLRGLIADVQRLGVRNQAPHGASEHRPCRYRDSQQAEKWIGPAWKQKPLHDDFRRRLSRGPYTHRKARKLWQPCSHFAQYGGPRPRLAMAAATRATLCRIVTVAFTRLRSCEGAKFFSAVCRRPRKPRRKLSAESLPLGGYRRRVSPGLVKNTAKLRMSALEMRTYSRANEKLSASPETRKNRSRAESIRLWSRGYCHHWPSEVIGRTGHRIESSADAISETAQSRSSTSRRYSGQRHPAGHI